MYKNKVILLNFLPTIESSYVKKGSIYPSTATLLLGTTLKKNGFDVQIIDGAYYEDYLEILRKSILEDQEKILYIGMSVMVTQIPFALEASKIIKKCNRSIPVVWGGPHPTLFPEQTLKNENVDIVAINEGTFTALDLAECIKKSKELSSVKGIGFKDENNRIFFTSPSELEEINKLPHFDFSLIDITNYTSTGDFSPYRREFPRFNGEFKIMPILTGLGCPYKCEFCINVILKRRYRFRSAESIIEEIKNLQDNYGVNTFLFYDEDFFINKRRTLEFISLVEKEELHFNFRMWCRVDHFKDDYIDSELIKRLCRIGYGSLAMGGESGDSEVLINLKKGITPEQIMDSLRILSKCENIFPRYSFIVGLENETMEQIKNTYRFCLDMKKINPDVDIAGPFVFRLYPGSPIFNRIVEKYKLKLPDSLELWSESITSFGSVEKMPWTPFEFQKKSELLVFYSLYALGYYKNELKNYKQILIFLLSKFSLFRIKYFLFIFPFEYWMYLVVMRFRKIAEIRLIK